MCNHNFESKKGAIAHYNTPDHKNKLNNLIHFLSGVDEDSAKDQGSRDFISHDSEEEAMRKFEDMLRDEEIERLNPWVTKDVRNYVESSIKHFQSLLSWSETLQTNDNWNYRKINDISYGLSKCLHTSELQYCS